MTNIEKLRRALAFAEELKFNDAQTTEFFKLILNFDPIRITFPINQPFINIQDTPNLDKITWDHTNGS